jgi:hypothetical protein
MASSAVNRQIHVLTVGVTCLTIKIAMQAYEGKTRRFVSPLKACPVKPLIRRVALRAVRTELSPVNVSVTIDTFSSGFCKNKARMAINTFDTRMPAHEREFCLSVMFKIQTRPKLRPACCRVTGLTIN